MITLNTEKGLVRIESWDDVLSRPGFTVDVDPNSVKLRQIIGSYQFKDFIKCGLSTCHQPHGRGYLVVTVDGRETNIGKDCGKTHFSVDFESMRRAYDRDLKNKERRESLETFKAEVPAILRRTHALKEDQFGANWIYRKISALLTLNRGLPSDVVTLMTNRAHARDGSLTVQRLATREERELAEASGQRAPTEQMYIDERVGLIEGVSALFPENDMRLLMVDTLERGLNRLSEAEIDSLSDRELIELNKLATEIKPALKKAEDAIHQGHRLLTKNNLSQILRFIKKSKDRKTFTAYLSELL